MKFNEAKYKEVFENEVDDSYDDAYMARIYYLIKSGRMKEIARIASEMLDLVDVFLIALEGVYRERDLQSWLREHGFEVE